MGCNLSQEPSTVPIDDDNEAKTDNDINAEADIKNESDNNKTQINDTSNEILMVNGDPLGKDEGKLIINSNQIFPH